MPTPSNPVPVDVARRSIEQYGTRDFPCAIMNDAFCPGGDESLNWHWHPQLEFSVIQQGRFCYTVRKESFDLSAGEGIFVNSNCLHAGRLHHAAPNTVMTSVIFSPSFLAAPDSDIYYKYVYPALSSGAALRLSHTVPWQSQVLTALQELFSLSAVQTGYELLCRSLISSAWVQMITHHNSLLSAGAANPSSAKEQRLKDMLSFLREHYGESLSVAQIAGAANISPSECYRCFQTIGKTPLGCLLDIRLEQAAVLLRTSRRSISQIAYACGFPNASYFDKKFRETYGCVPKDYRKCAPSS